MGVQNDLIIVSTASYLYALDKCRENPVKFILNQVSKALRFMSMFIKIGSICILWRLLIQFSSFSIELI